MVRLSEASSSEIRVKSLILCPAELMFFPFGSQVQADHRGQGLLDLAEHASADVERVLRGGQARAPERAGVAVAGQGLEVEDAPHALPGVQGLQRRQLALSLARSTLRVARSERAAEVMTAPHHIDPCLVPHRARPIPPFPSQRVAGTRAPASFQAHSASRKRRPRLLQSCSARARPHPTPHKALQPPPGEAPRTLCRRPWPPHTHAAPATAPRAQSRPAGYSTRPPWATSLQVYER